MRINTSLILLWAICQATIISCKKEDPPLVEENPPTTIIRCTDFEHINYGPTADTLFVDVNHNNANDSNQGSDINHPLKTITKAIEKINKGTIVLIREGNYSEGSLVITKSGELKKPIIISAFPTSSGYENVVIDGTGKDEETIGILLDNGAGNISISGLKIKNIPYAGIAANDEPLLPYENITLKDLLIENTGVNSNPNSGYGIILYGPKNFRIINVESRNNNLDGISVWGINEDLYAENGFIVNCHSHHNDDGVDGWESDAHGIAINQGINIGVCNCQANDNSDHGFDASDYPKGGKISTNISFEENISFNNQNIGFATNSDSRSILYLRNIAYENNWGFGCYEGVGTLWYYHNITFKNRHGFYLDGGYANYVDPGGNAISFANNIFYNNELTDFYQNENGYELTFNHNDFFNTSNETLIELKGTKYKPSNINDLGNNNINELPEFANDNPATLDLNLKSNSPLIDAGMEVSINNSYLIFNGTAPDIGVNEN